MRCCGWGAMGRGDLGAAIGWRPSGEDGTLRRPAGDGWFIPRGRGDGGEAGGGGWDARSAGGERLFYPAGAGADPPEWAAPYDVAFLDMLGDPAQLGRLRARGLVRADTITVVAFADHRDGTAGGLERRGRLWRVGG